MLPEIARLKAHKVGEFVIEAAARFLESGDPSIPRKLRKIGEGEGTEHVGEAVLGDGWGDGRRQLVRFFTHFSEGHEMGHDHLAAVLAYAQDRTNKVSPEVAAGVVEEVESTHRSLEPFIELYLRRCYPYKDKWHLAGDPGAKDPFVSPVANFIFRHITPEYEQKVALLTNHTGLFPVLAVQRPELTRAWCEQTAKSPVPYMSEAWKAIIKTSKDYDSLCLDCCEDVVKHLPAEAFAILGYLNEARGGVYAGRPLALVKKYPAAVLEEDTLKYLMKHHEAEVVPLMVQACADPAVDDYILYFDSTIYQRVFVKGYECWDSGGSGMLRNLLETVHVDGIETLLTEVFKKLKPEHYPVLREGILERMKGLDASDQKGVWKGVAERYTEAFLPEFEAMLTGSSKPLRELAAKALAKVKKKDGLGMAATLLESEKPVERLGAVALLQKQGTPAAIAALQAAFEKEQPDEVRAALLKALAACGVKVKAAKKEGAAAVGLAELEAGFAKQAAKLKLPGVGWFKALSLPPLFATDGSKLSAPATTFLIATQAKHKEMDAAPEVLSLLEHIDRERSTPFAKALVDGFLGSSQAAGDRWALTLAALTGDKRILTSLIPQIHAWCKGTRSKLAEFAAQAIGLLPGNEPVAVLEGLVNRYRFKPKNVGKAAALAFAAAAEERGITPEELSDEVAPNLGFNAGGKRLFEWERGKANAELEPDFKLTWSDPDSGKTWKSLPSSASDEVKAEVKFLTKLLKEVVGDQSARLEMTMVCQRRWTVARWRELYENHPLLRPITGGLVWGIYDASGTLLRTFRRYPNGLLANATGDLEEIPETDVKIGIVHPLELDEAALDAWRAHLARFKVEPPFPQIDRPVERLDPLHGNRSELTQGKRRDVDTSGFRSRSEKRGWLRGPVTDEGEIAHIFKSFPGLGIEVMWSTGGYLAMTGLGDHHAYSAYFVNVGSAESELYIYNEPKTSDPNLLTFDKVPAVVWSEVVCDLKAIVGENKK